MLVASGVAPLAADTLPLAVTARVPTVAAPANSSAPATRTDPKLTLVERLPCSSTTTLTVDALVALSDTAERAAAMMAPVPLRVPLMKCVPLPSTSAVVSAVTVGPTTTAPSS
jgi:hypothetical protein